jgi:hypothetical protein
MGENPSPLGEAFKVDDPLAPPAEAGGLGNGLSKDPRSKFVGSGKSREVAMFVMCWRGAAA